MSKQIRCTLNPHLPAAEWTGKTIGERVKDCAVMLYCHNFLTASEYQQVSARITEWMSQNKPQVRKRSKKS